MTEPDATGPSSPALAADPATLLRSRNYVALLLLSAVIGAPIAAASYFYLKAVGLAQHGVFVALPHALGLSGTPAWWPLAPLALGGLLVALSIRLLPGTSGHRPAEGLKPQGAVQPPELYGIVVASFATLALGAVLGPEAPLIALGGGLGVLGMQSVRRGAPRQAAAMVGAAGSFAAIATLMGSPLAGAFLLMEAAGLGSGMMSVVLVPGLLAAGIGALIFTGLDDWTGFGTFNLAIPQLPHANPPTGTEFLWAVVAGVAAGAFGSGIRRAALLMQPWVERGLVLRMPVVGLAVGGCAAAFAAATGREVTDVLFSGQSALPTLVQNAGGWTVGALLLLLLFKGLGYVLSLSCFRGGPVFPGVFLGAAGGIALAHLPGLPMIAGVGMGMGALTVAVLRLPLTSVLLASLLLKEDAVVLMPLVIVAVVVSYVVSVRLSPPPAPARTAP